MKYCNIYRPTKNNLHIVLNQLFIDSNLQCVKEMYIDPFPEQQTINYYQKYLNTIYQYANHVYIRTQFESITVLFKASVLLKTASDKIFFTSFI